ncbi:Crp/Fnr family transcriptional regulator [Flavobacterium quisquiliarum]|uniref:Crp/Fnr family transcriptional regulator n=1 Tax=Flavobacterium quisquiliarum TaxID=1834436 RepID=A0ABV8W348_9FLAO|nr:Crp/Fnr family transcriptional regulator [Flavobacterium quisquiliarum]MBW1658385.1 cyclic nucleotide-binding domain-containing protein [Flavobacterium quisquiliarum]NWL02335.1 CarD family transcriptional regulator [Flavobacterium collinsii]
MTSLIEYFRKLGFAENTLSEFLSCIKTRQFSANELILVQGQIENYLSFIDTGVVRYYVVANDKEITFDFAFKDTFYCAYDSFYNRTQTRIYVQALTDCQLYSISHENLQRLYEKCETAKKLGRIATEYLLDKKVKRELALLTKTPQERYEKLLFEQPKYIKQIPLKYLASYIGIVPETLSRIRKRIS